MQYTIHCRLQCTLPLHSSDLVIFGQIHCIQCTAYTSATLQGYTACTLQSMQCSCSLHCTVHAVYIQCTLQLPCSSTACTLHFGLGFEVSALRLCIKELNLCFQKLVIGYLHTFHFGRFPRLGIEPFFMPHQIVILRL